MADALTWFLDGFSRFRRLPADALVLPSHGFPFIGLHTRLDQLVAHHDARLNDMTAAIARRGAAGATGWDMVPVLFPRHLDNNQVVFAFGETLAHLHCLETRARVKRIVGRRRAPLRRPGRPERPAAGRRFRRRGDGYRPDLA